MSLKDKDCRTESIADHTEEREFKNENTDFPICAGCGEVLCGVHLNAIDRMLNNEGYLMCMCGKLNHVSQTNKYTTSIDE